MTKWYNKRYWRKH